MNCPKPLNPYLISGTNVLRNLIGATTVTELEAAENDLVSARMLEFQSNPPVAQGTLRQLQQIHRQLFQDIYDWAGQIRTVDIAKGSSQVFQSLAFFDVGVQYAERMLKEDHLLRGLDRETFVERISVHYDNFSILHPSERVMSRTKIVWNLVVRDAGWRLNWHMVSKQENDRALQIAKETADESSLVAMFTRIVLAFFGK